MAKSLAEQPGTNSSDAEVKAPRDVPVEDLDSVTIRFAGDSGDGMQLTGTQFTLTAAIVGNDIATFPDFPSEIRAPAGSVPGVSGFQVSFSSHDVRTPGDTIDVLVAMNPAALAVNLKDLPKGGILVVNTDAFTFHNLKKANYETDPLKGSDLQPYRVIRVPMTQLTEHALTDVPLNRKEKERCKNFCALGLMYWLFSRPLDPTLAWIDEKFGRNPATADANKLALRAGHHFGETTEQIAIHYRVRKAELPMGEYRQLTGNQAVALGLMAAAHAAGRTLFYGSYPITPASEILQELSRFKNFNVLTFQAEDEIAAIGSAIGASFAGALGATGTSGPGMALKSEAIGLAVMTELPLVIINVQRGGPSTGLPTKTEQGDLFQAVHGRNSESPVVVLAAASPSDCFAMTVEAARIATTYMTPVILLTDGYLANGTEPWLIPALEDLPEFPSQHLVDAKSFQPYQRDEKTLARPWVLPGTKGLEHRIGGLEKADVTGVVSHDPLNHDRMTRLRAEKVERVADVIPPLKVFGEERGKVLVVGWGSTYGPITSAVEDLHREGKPVSSVHLRYINPLPKDLGRILGNFKTVLVPEMNLGQLSWLLRARYLVDVVSLTKVQGRPFKIREVREEIERYL